ncbi:uncharacterized protein [Clytia hemisphaerica]|uniref:Uncharacterized protein n=1 Tax=Clytia hemisphaerica TaxID=252671 RepID=A0A7M5TXD9_9CNID
MGGRNSTEKNSTDPGEEWRKKRRKEKFYCFIFKEQEWWFSDVFGLLREKRYAEFEEIVKHEKEVINNLTYENKYEPTMLIHAIEYTKENPHYYPEGYDHSIVEYLSNHEHCDINIPDSVSQTPFYFATVSGNLPAVKSLLARDRSVLNKTTFMRSPLHLAVRHKELVEFFLQQPDLDVDIRDYHRKTPDQIEGIDKDIKKMIQDYRKKSKENKQ